MGNCGSGFGESAEPQDPLKEGTTLIELQIDNIRDAHDFIGQRPKGSYTPVTIMPTARDTCLCCIPCCFAQIPSGFSAIVTKFGAVVDGEQEDGTWSAGCHCVSPLNHVDRLVTQQMIIFDTPVKDCKTKDNISVNIDVLLTFEIKNAKDFVFNIGPAKFDDLLRASQDEALRQMASETAVEDIYDLFGKQTSHIIEDLNKKFDRFGVMVHNFTVKNVRLPREMAQDFEDKTLFDTKTSLQRMQQTFDRLTVNNEEGKQKLREECDNAQKAAEQQADVTKNQAIKETSEVVAQTEKEISELKANRNEEVNQVLANVELDAATKRAQILDLEREVKSKTSADVGSLSAEAEAFARAKESEGNIVASEKEANGKRALGEAEGAASAAFAARRAHEAGMKRLDVLSKLTSNNSVQIAGSQENTVGLSADNSIVTQVAQQGLEALRAKLAQSTASSLASLAAAPGQNKMRERLLPQ